MDTLLLKVVTPAGLVLEEQVKEVILPAAEGEIGILPQHTKYIGTLGIGVLEYVTPTSSTVRLAITGGFCSFSDNTLQVLADFVDTIDEVDRATYDSERASLQNFVALESSLSPEWAQASAKLRRIETIDRLLAVH